MLIYFVFKIGQVSKSLTLLVYYFINRHCIYNINLKIKLTLAHFSEHRFNFNRTTILLNHITFPKNLF